MRGLFVEGILLLLIAGVVPLVITSLVSILVGALQAATHVQEQTSLFLIKLLVTGGVLTIGAPMLWARAQRLTTNAFTVMIETCQSDAGARAERAWVKPQ